MFAANLLVVIVVIPVVAAFIGFITNWAAVRMLFVPERFVGVWKIGWQGVIHAKGDAFAVEVANTVGDVVTPSELVDRLDPAALETLLADAVDEELPEMLREAVESLAPGVWDDMAPVARETILEQVRGEIRSLASELFDDLRTESDDLLDLQSLVHEMLAGDNTSRLARLVQEIGEKELRAIIAFGGVFGFIIGCVQAVAFGLFDRWWIMPIVGGLVGLGTNWLALQMIFRPLEPTRYLGLATYQGMFPARQASIARDYGIVAAREILTPQNLIRIMVDGPGGARIAALVEQKANERVEKIRPMLSMVANESVSDGQIEEVKAAMIDRMGQRASEMQPVLEEYLSEHLGTADLVESNLASMPPRDFERLLRGVFEQDEWILIALGGALGTVVGLLQGLVVLGVG